MRPLSTTQPTATRWLGATSVHSGDEYFPTMRTSLKKLCDAHPPLSVIVNLFNRGAPEDIDVSRDHQRMSTTRVPGMKTAFWKAILTPERTASFQIVWLFDADVAVHPAVMPLRLYTDALLATRASILQPTMRGGGRHNGQDVRATDHIHLRDSRVVHSSCLVGSVHFVEVMTPLLQQDAWAAFHREVLMQIADDALELSDFGIDVTWCSFVAQTFKGRPACVAHFGAPALHLNSGSITRFMNHSNVLEERNCGRTCKTLKAKFPQHFGNRKHDMKRCWSAGGNGLVPTGLSRGVDESGRVHGLPKQRDTDSLGWDEGAMWLGAVAIPKSFGAKQTTQLLIALRYLMNAYPALRVVINIPTIPLDDEKFFKDTHVSDARFRYSNVTGSAALFWKRVLTPAVIRGMQAVWLFDVSLVVHPSVLPLGVLMRGLEGSDAGALVPRRATAAPLNTTAKGGAPCTARSVVAPDRACTIFSTRPSGWPTFYSTVLAKMTDEAAQRMDAGLVLRTTCIAISRLLRRAGSQRPSCVELASAVVTLAPVKELCDRSNAACKEELTEAPAAAERGGCERAHGGERRKTCLYLQSLVGADVNLTATPLDRGGCWKANTRWGLVVGQKASVS